MKFQFIHVLANFLFWKANCMASLTIFSMRAGWAFSLYLSPGFSDFKSIQEYCLLNCPLPQLGIISPLLDLSLHFASVPLPRMITYWFFNSSQTTLCSTMVALGPYSSFIPWAAGKMLYPGMWLTTHWQTKLDILTMSHLSSLFHANTSWGLTPDPRKTRDRYVPPLKWSTI